MNIDPKKVQLSEKDLEDWLYENSSAFNYYGIKPITKWAARQFSVPSGVIDLLGINDAGQFSVVEVKNVVLTSSCLTQVCRYAHDISEICFRSIDGWREEEISKYLVGPYIPDADFLVEANALNVDVMQMQITFSAKLSRWGLSQEKKERDNQEIEDMSSLPIFQNANILRQAWMAIHLPENTDEENENG